MPLFQDARYNGVAGGFLTQFTAVGCLFSYGVFFTTFEDEFGWSRTLLSVSFSIGIFMMGAIGMIAGALHDRHGPRLLMSTTGVALGAGFALMSFMHSPWHLIVLFGAFVAMGLATHDVVTLSFVARAFGRRRGLFTAIVKTGTAVGQVVAPPLVAASILAMGWRQTTLALGLIAAALLLYAAHLLGVGAAANTRAASAAPAANTQPVAPAPLTDCATRQRLLWTLCLIQFSFFASLMSVPLHIAPHSVDLGMSQTQAATMLSTIGAGSVIGRFLLGFLTDKIGGKRSLLTGFALLISSLLALLLIANPVWLYAVAGAYGVAHGGFFTVMSPTVAEYFGLEQHGLVFGKVLFSGTVAGAIAPILVGYAHDQSGSYTVAFASLAGLAALGVVLCAALPSKARAHLTGQ